MIMCKWWMQSCASGGCGHVSGGCSHVRVVGVVMYD